MPKPAMDDVAMNQSYAHLLARWLVRPLLGTWVRPNHITLTRAGVGLVAAALLAVGTPSAWLWSGICWVIACVLDRADGELARMGDLRSAIGQRLDYYSDLTLDSLWFVGLGIGLRHTGLGHVAPMLGLLCGAAMALVQYSGEMYERLSGPGVKVWAGVRRFHPDDALFLFAVFTWAGTIVLVPVLIGTTAVLPVVAAVTTWRYLRLRATNKSSPGGGPPKAVEG
jgi:archaetidylinositol phosphate synthase